MKLLVLGLLLTGTACNNRVKQKEKITAISPAIKSPKDHVSDSIELISECESASFISSLEEYPNLRENAFQLTIKRKDGSVKKQTRLDLRASLSHIAYCTDDYTVLSFACGGPCYSQVFVFTEEERPNEQFFYAQRVGNRENLIAHIKDEEFEKLVVHNFDNGKEMIVSNPDIHWFSYGQMDTLYLKGKNLILEYQTEKERRRKKTVSLEQILF